MCMNNLVSRDNIVQCYVYAYYSITTNGVKNNHVFD